MEPESSVDQRSYLYKVYKMLRSAPKSVLATTLKIRKAFGFFDFNILIWRRKVKFLFKN